MLVKAMVLRLVWCLLAACGAQELPPLPLMRPVKDAVMPRRPGGAWPPLTRSPPKVIPPCDSVTYPGQLCLATRCIVITVIVKGLPRYKATCSPVGTLGIVGVTTVTHVPRTTALTTSRTLMKPLRGGESLWTMTPPYVQYPSKPVARTRYRQSTKPDTSSTYLFKTTTKKAKTTDTSSTMLVPETTENKCGDNANCVYREEDVDTP